MLKGNYFVTLAKLISTILLVFSTLLVNMLFAQQIFTGRAVDPAEKPDIPVVPEYQVYEMEMDEISSYVHGKGNHVPIGFIWGNIELKATLDLRPIRKQGLVSYVMTEEGLKVGAPRPEILFTGVSEAIEPTNYLFAINTGFFAGAFTHEGRNYIVEPMWWHIDEAPKNRVIIYESSIVQFLEDHKCGTDGIAHIHDHDDEGEIMEEDGRATPCREVEYGSALDWSFVSKYNGESGAWNRIDFVMGLVTVQYTGHFNWDFDFVRTAEFASTCSTCDPPQWSNTNNASTLLGNFRTWGNGGGFGNEVYDVAGLWTNRNFSGGTVGIAYVGGMCNNSRYHALQDFSSAGWAMRVMVSHEIGHNLNYGHDGGSGWIMSPSVNNTTQWSNPSKNTINNFVNGNGGNCLDNCFPAAPPTANFSSSESSGCVPLTINFIDQSTGGPTSWQWTFPGGDPGTSSLQNPTVTYNTKGSYNVTLTVSNPAGSNTKTESNYINANDVPTTYFEYIPDENIVHFINLSDGATSYFWEFGDGHTSTQESPIHVYENDGVYQVIFSTTNECGTTSQTEWIEIVTTPIADFASDEFTGCAPLTVHFEDMSTPNTTNWLWVFQGGTPDSSTQQHPVVEYAIPGTYSVSLRASNAAGQTTKIRTDYIIVKGLPPGGFEYDVKIDSVFFSVQGTPDSVFWDFGDGGTSENPNPTYVYAQEGTYEVAMTMYTECGDTTYFDEVTIVFLPEAGFSGNPIQGCAPLAVDFMQSASPNTEDYFWSFPGGVPDSSTDPNPTVDYANPGKYAVTLIVTNSAGSDTLTLTNYVDVLDDPVALFTAVVNNGNELVLTNNSQFGTSYLWDFGDGNTSTEEEPEHTYSEEGEFTVTLWVYNQCDTSVYTSTVNVVLPPSAGFSASPLSGCASLEVQFFDESSESVTAWLWTFESGSPASSTDPNPTVIYHTPGVYSVKLEVSNPIGVGTIEVVDYIEVLDVPVPDFGTTQNNGTVYFSNQSQFGTSYEWNFGDGGASTDENPTHTYQEEGTYEVELIVTNECGASSITYLIEVFFAPRALFTAQPTTGCGEELVVQFTNLTEGEVFGIQWYFPGGTPDESTDLNPIVTYTTPGLFDVILIASGPGGRDTLHLHDYIVFASDVPLAGFDHEAVDLEVTFTNKSLNGATYLWDFGDGQSSTLQHPVHVYTSSGQYFVTLIATNPCGSDTTVIEISVINSSTDLPRFLQDVQVIPNPNNGTFILEMKGLPVGVIDVDVVDILGRAVFQSRLDLSSSHLRQELSLPNVSAGSYFLRLYHGGEMYTHLIQVAH